MKSLTLTPTLEWLMWDVEGCIVSLSLGKCSGTPSGGCVVGRCREACSSWVPVPWCGLSSLLAGWTQKLVHYFPYIKL